MKKTRVLILGMSQDVGGVETYIINLLKAMKGGEYVFYFPKQDGTLAYEDYLRQEHVIISTPVPHRKYWRYKKMWLNIMKEYQFDIVYYNTCDIVSIDVLRFAKKAGIPVRIIHSHSTGIQQAIGKNLSLLHRIAEKNNHKNLDKYATHLFACSEAAGKWMFDNRDFKIIKNGINLNKYKFNLEYRNSCRKELNMEQKILIGCVGRLDAEKNPFFSIGVFNELLKKHSDAALLFIGDGALGTELKKEVAAKELDGQIKFLGARDDVNKWLSAMDCLLMPSFFEGLPFVLIEAQASGLSCVVSSEVSQEANITGLVEYIDLDADKQQWADRLIELSKKERIDTADSLIESGYAIEATAGLVSKIIDTALGE